MRIKQRHLEGTAKRSLRWGSHIPLNNTVLRTFPITGVLELGAGMNSTPVFFKNADNVVSIEADKDWIQKLLDEKIVVEDEFHSLVHHELPAEYYRGTRKEQIDPKVLKDSIKFFKKFKTKDINFMFVDCYAGWRLEAIEKMYKTLDVVTYHDAEPEEDRHYGYSTFKADEKYLHFVDRTFLANTGILINKKYADLMPKFLEVYAEEAEAYAAKFNALHKVTIEDQK